MKYKTNKAYYNFGSHLIANQPNMKHCLQGVNVFNRTLKKKKPEEEESLEM